ncbi:hypothetical protein OQA88_8637 [Cercophora sp. LCS_1]
MVAKLPLCTLLLLPLSLAGTICFLIGCMSPGTRDLAIYRVNITELASELVNLSANTTHKTSDLVHPRLPSYWYYGLSGVCDFFADGPDPIRGPTTSGETKCRRSFPPKTDVLSILQDSLRANIETIIDPDRTEKSVASVLTAWEETLADVPPSRLRDKESSVESQAKAAAALAILSILLDIANAGVSFTGSTIAVCCIGLLSTVLSIVAGVCAILAMNNGMHGVVRTTGNASGSLIFLCAGEMLRPETEEEKKKRRKKERKEEEARQRQFYYP